MGLGNHNTAEDYYHRAIRLFPANTDTRGLVDSATIMRMGLLYYDLGELARSLKLFAEALDQIPTTFIFDYLPAY